MLARLSVALSLGPRRGAGARRLSEEAIAAARDADDPLALGYSLAVVVRRDRRPRRRRPATRTRSAEILACASAVNDTRLELLGRRLRVVALLEAGPVAKADEEIAAFADRADRLGQVVYSWYVPLWRAHARRQRGALRGRRAAAGTRPNGSARWPTARTPRC